MRRVVVTGLGMVSPLGCGVETTWKRILNGESGARKIEKFDVSDLPCKIAMPVPREGEGAFNPDDWMDPKESKRVDDFIVYAMSAATQALNDAGWKPQTEEEKCRTGTLIGSGIGGLEGIAETALTLQEKGPRRVSPFFITGRLINLSKLFAYGEEIDSDAARLIALDDADVMVAGGAESAICRIGIAGFAACRALSTGYNDTPEKASRPYDKDRDGFVMGEGAGIVVLEEYEHAKARGAKIYGEVVGYGLSGDAYHVTAPPEDGEGGFRSMQAALKRAGISPSDLDYVNAHGTSTMADTIELGAVTRLLGNAVEKVSMSSTKSSIGHLLGAAGAVEAIFCLLAMRDSILPPTINLDNPAVDTMIDLVPNKARQKEVNYALSNSFGFGGTNASLVMKKVDG